MEDRHKGCVGGSILFKCEFGVELGLFEDWSDEQFYYELFNQSGQDRSEGDGAQVRGGSYRFNFGYRDNGSLFPLRGEICLMDGKVEKVR